MGYSDMHSADFWVCWWTRNAKAVDLEYISAFTDNFLMWRTASMYATWRGFRDVTLEEKYYFLAKKEHDWAQE